jgi:acyl-CoA dehydrogenase
MTCGAVDRGERPSVISAIVKYQCTERMRRVVNEGMDVLAGSGICLGPRNLLGRIYQAAPIAITVEGANILTRSMIIFGQGVIRCHPYVLKEMKAVTSADVELALAGFDGLLRHHAAFFLSNAARALFLGITGGRFARAPAVQHKSYYRMATRLSTALALAADAALLTLGGSLKRRERISARLADILSHLYLLSALLKRINDRQWPAEELPLFQWAYDDSAHRIQESFAELFDNLPSRPAAWLLRSLVFPFGRRFRCPHDRLGARLAGILMEPSPLRDRLTSGIFIPADSTDALGRLEDALKKVEAAEPVEKKLKDAVKDGRLKVRTQDAAPEAGVQAGVITGDEAELLRQAEEARSEVILVDDFPRLPNPG